jgi:HlyD family type I secretion membrane fusion protein
LKLSVADSPDDSTRPAFIHGSAAGNASATPNADYRSVVRLGLAILCIGFLGFFLWAALAPLDEGVPAPGIVSVESKRKRLDHLTGGIIEKFSVREGEHVKEGQPLITLNEVQAKAALNSVVSQWRVAAAADARLRAERDGARRVTFPKELTDSLGDPEVASAVRAQEELFRSRRGALEGELHIIRESLKSLEMQIRSLNQLQVDREKQVQLFQQQLASYRNLHSQGFVSRNQLLDLERQLAEVQSRESETLANIAGTNAHLAEFRTKAAQRELEYRREVETQLADAQRDLATLSERVIAQRDTYSRLTLAAPASGTVVDLAFHTVGAVIKPGDRILDIVPQGDELIVEARVPPQYIDRIRAGLPADVHFDAYMQRALRPVLGGKVVTVSADALSDERTGQAYYAIRVTVPGEEVQKLGTIKLQPGMQGTVMIKTGERSLLVYLARPLLRRFQVAMGEN